MFDNIQGAILSLTTAGDIAKGLIQLNSQAERQVQVIELQSAILSAQSSALAAQSEHSAMIQKIRDLEGEVARIKAWDETKQRYQLITPFEGCQVYALKKSSNETDPPHWICPQCYEDGRKSILIDADEAKGMPRIKCFRCQFETAKRTYDPRQYV